MDRALLPLDARASDLLPLLPVTRGGRALVIGVGGGADIITAYAIATRLDVGDGAAVYGNTKTRAEPDLVRRSPHVARVPPRLVERAQMRAKHGSTDIERAVPRGADGCPLVCVLPARYEDDALVAGELAAMRFDHIIAVDTGGDVLEPPRNHKRAGRDRRMLAILNAVGAPVRVVVVSPCSDGQCRPERFASWFDAAAGSFVGAATLASLMPTFEEYAEHLSPTRTTSLIVAAHKAAARGEATLCVPRGCNPTVPVTWMTSALVFDGAL